MAIVVARATVTSCGDGTAMVAFVIGPLTDNMGVMETITLLVGDLVTAGRLGRRLVVEKLAIHFEKSLHCFRSTLVDKEKCDYEMSQSRAVAAHPRCQPLVGYSWIVRGFLSFPSMAVIACLYYNRDRSTCLALVEFRPDLPR